MAFKSFRPSGHKLQSSVLRQRPGINRLQVLCKESRIGRAPIPIPKNVQVTLEGNVLKVKGPLGTLERAFSPVVKLEQVEGKLKLTKTEDTRLGISQHGLSRTLASNMVVGVSTGFERRLELIGTGYRASVAGSELTLNVGYSKPRILAIPPGVKVTVEKNTTLVLSSFDKVAVGDFCAKIRFQRPPEPYKGKGIREAGEVIKLKEGKGAGGKKK